MKKRILSVLLSLAMLVSLVPLTATTSYAAEEETGVQLLWELFAKASGADQIDDILDALSDVPTYSTLDGERRYKTYLSLGDSTAFGYGLGTLAPDQADFDTCYGWGKADGSCWPHKLAENLGIQFPKNTATESNLTTTPWYLDVTNPDNHFANLAMGNVRTWDLHYLLGEDEAYDGFTEQYMLDLYQENCYVTNDSYDAVKVSQGEHADTVQQVRALVKKNIEAADLISIAVGGNDFGTYCFLTIMNDNLERYWKNWDYLMEENPELAALKEAFSELFEEVLQEENPSASSESLSVLVNHLLYCFLGGVTQIDDIVEKIHTMNPDADIVLTSVYNPYRDVVIKEPTTGATLYGGKILSLILSLANQVYRLEAVKHPSYVAYVDISDVETIADVQDPPFNMNLLENTTLIDQLTADNGVYSHESKTGHSQIASWVYDALGRPAAYDEDLPETEVVREPQSLTEHSEKVLLLMKAMKSSVETIVGTEGKEALESVQTALGDQKDTTAGRLIQAGVATGAFCSGFRKTVVESVENEDAREVLKEFGSNAESLVKETIETGKAAVKIVTAVYTKYSDFMAKFPLSTMMLDK